MKCPVCGGKLLRVRNESGWMNNDQFDAVKAGDWMCETCPDNGRGQSGKCYWWNSEVESNQAKECEAICRL